MVDKTPAEVFPAGDYLREELEERGWNQTEFAEIIGRSPRLVNEIVRGKRGITPATAKEIAAALGTSAEVWLNLDAAYQLWKSDPAPDRIRQEARIRERFPVREMVRRGWLASSENPAVLESQILTFFEIDSIDDAPQIAHAAKRTDWTPVQLAWLFRVKQAAMAMPALPKYSATKLRARLDELRSLMTAPEELRHVPRLLSECGIRFVVVEPLPGSKIDGVCLWLDKETPVIGMSLRFDRIDNFWFVLRHEIEHVLKGHGKRYGVIVDSDLESVKAADENKEEREANFAAAEFAVPTEELEDFIRRIHPLYTDQRVTGFARRLEVHPGIAAGRLRKQLNRWDLFTRLLVKVRHIITPVSMTDGYGHLLST